jgi:predicted DCC family thiol-disulfide oxidoreductase YuxK
MLSMTQTVACSEHSSEFSQALVQSTPIIFFDGDCVMCSGLVDVLLQIDREGIFRLTPLQGQTAKQVLPPFPPNREAWSIYYLDRNGLYAQSDAVIQIFKQLGGLWSVIGMVQAVPTSFRDRMYRIIAQNRYRLFGRRATCRMPSELEKKRFLP